MKRISSIFLVMLLAVAVTFAQDKGVKFEETLNWQQVKEKAKAENKYIFLDMVATWCAPCKKMDAEVYSTEKVGDAVNGKFIAVKVQVDKTDKDSEHVKSWYATAEALSKEYQIMSLPSYLFFSPDGNIVHKGSAFLPVDDFFKLINAALDPEQQFYTKYYAGVSNYRKGIKDYKGMLSLILTSESMGNTGLKDSLSRDYVHNYLFKLSDAELFTKDNMAILSRTVGYQSSNDRFFKLLYNDKTKADLADNLIGLPGWAASMVETIVSKEEINDKIYKDGKIIDQNPDWKSMQAAISKKYNAKLAEKLVLITEVNYYQFKKDWKKYANAYDQKLKKFPPIGLKAGDKKMGESFHVNNAAWDVFLQSDEKWFLEKALSWSTIATTIDEDPNPNFFDTKANILYKLGRVKDAIATEELAIEKDRVFTQKNKLPKSYFEDSFKATIEKMKRGEPTWPVK